MKVIVLKIAILGVGVACEQSKPVSGDPRSPSISKEEQLLRNHLRLQANQRGSKDPTLCCES